MASSYVDTVVVHVQAVGSRQPEGPDGEAFGITGGLRINDDYQRQRLPLNWPYEVWGAYKVGRPAANGDFNVTWMRGNVQLTGDAGVPSWGAEPSGPDGSQPATRWNPFRISGYTPGRGGVYRGTISVNQP